MSPYAPSGQDACGVRLSNGSSDLRRARGDRSRQTVLRLAVDLASIEGLESLSFGRLAARAGMSKAGVQTLFGNKQALQVATVDVARELFLDAVVRPTAAEPSGVARLRALLQRWIDYVEEPLLEGGCFRVANMANYDSHPGPVRDALARDQQEWTALLAAELRFAAQAGQASVQDADLAAFQLDAVLCAVNTALRLGDTTAIHKLWQTMGGMLETAARPEVHASSRRGRKLL